MDTEVIYINEKGEVIEFPLVTYFIKSSGNGQLFGYSDSQMKKKYRSGEDTISFDKFMTKQGYRKAEEDEIILKGKPTVKSLKKSGFKKATTEQIEAHLSKTGYVKDQSTKEEEIDSNTKKDNK